MNSNDIFKLLACVGKATARKLPEIIEPLPVYGKVLGGALAAFRQGIDDYHNQKISAEEYGQIKSAFDDTVKKEAAQVKPPTFMDCVIFRCKSGYTLSDAQRGMLADVFEGEEDEETGIISGFIEDYMGGMISEDEDYSIGDDYVSLNFTEYDEYPYDEEVLCQLKQALNRLIGCDAFDYFVASGHEVSHDI
ncbi:MAG: hypothetical protein HDR18_14460 [Lachnospiraceae bacterium]|nr:hypothetical protein [Lachnospiraceae bacterium]